MSRLVLYMSMSLNGFIAGPADDKDDLLGAGHRRYRHRMGWPIPLVLLRRKRVQRRHGRDQ